MIYHATIYLLYGEIIVQDGLGDKVGQIILKGVNKKGVEYLNERISQG